MVAVPVTVHWVTKNHPSEPYSYKEVAFDGYLTTYSKSSDLEICEEVFRQTNIYNGEFYEQVARWASKDRGHTAVSVGDKVTVRGNVYECADFSWRVISKVDA